MEQCLLHACGSPLTSIAKLELGNGTTWLIAKQSLVLYSDKAVSLLTQLERSKESLRFKSGGGDCGCTDKIQTKTADID